MLQAQWDRLAFAQAIDGSVPFLPLVGTHSRGSRAKDGLTESEGPNYKHWAELQWDSRLVNVYSREFIKYTRLANVDDEGEEVALTVGMVPMGAENKSHVFLPSMVHADCFRWPVQKLREMLKEHAQRFRYHSASRHKCNQRKSSAAIFKLLSDQKESIHTRALPRGACKMDNVP